MSYIVTLLRRFKQGENEVFNEILNEANPFVKQMISKYSRNKYVRKDHDEDDLRSVVYETVFKVCMRFDFERMTNGIRTIDDIGHEKKYYAMLRREMMNRMAYEVEKWGGHKKYKNTKRCCDTVSLETKVSSNRGDEASLGDMISSVITPSPMTEAMTNEIMNIVRDKLTDVSRSIFELKMQGYTISEISRRLGMTPSAIMSSIQQNIVPAYRSCN